MERGERKVRKKQRKMREGGRYKDSGREGVERERAKQIGSIYRLKTKIKGTVNHEDIHIQI